MLYETGSRKKCLLRNIYKIPFGPKPAFGGSCYHTLEHALPNSIMILAKATDMSTTLTGICIYLNGLSTNRHWCLKLRRWFSCLPGTGSLFWGKCVYNRMISLDSLGYQPCWVSGDRFPAKLWTNRMRIYWKFANRCTKIVRALSARCFTSIGPISCQHIFTHACLWLEQEDRDHWSAK